MDSYKIVRTEMGWGLFRSGSTRPVAEASTKEELVMAVAALVAGKAASVRVHNENGTFEEMRF